MQSVNWRYLRQIARHWGGNLGVKNVLYVVAIALFVLAAAAPQGYGG
jgi:hypothetical protein